MSKQSMTTNKKLETLEKTLILLKNKETLIIKNVEKYEKTLFDNNDNNIDIEKATEPKKGEKLKRNENPYILELKAKISTYDDIIQLIQILRKNKNVSEKYLFNISGNI